MHQLILGNEAFVQHLQSTMPATSAAGISKAQRSTLIPALETYQINFKDRDNAMAAAYRTNAYTLTEIARHFGVSHATVSRAVKKRR